MSIWKTCIVRSPEHEIWFADSSRHQAMTYSVSDFRSHLVPQGK